MTLTGSIVYRRSLLHSADPVRRRSQKTASNPEPSSNHVPGSGTAVTEVNVIEVAPALMKRVSDGDGESAPIIVDMPSLWNLSSAKPKPLAGREGHESVKGSQSGSSGPV